LKISFAEAPIGRDPGARQAARVEARRSGRNSDEWLFGDGIDGVCKELFKPCARPVRIRKIDDLQIFKHENAPASVDAARPQNLHSLNCCAPHND
jgi:hypothetical protein